MQKKYRETLKIKGHIERSIVSFIFSCFCRSVDVIHVRIMYQLIIVLHVPVSVRWDNRTNHRCVCVCVLDAAAAYIGVVISVTWLRAHAALWCSPRLVRFTVRQVRPWDDQSAWPYSVSAVQIDAGRRA